PVFLAHTFQTSITHRRLTLTTREQVVPLIHRDGERRALWRFSRKPCELVNEVVERRSEVLGVVASDQAEPLRRLTEHMEVPNSPSILAGALRHVVRLAVDEDSHLVYQRVEVFEGAIQLRLHAIEGMDHAG